jgi:hypothetical protein
MFKDKKENSKKGRKRGKIHVRAKVSSIYKLFSSSDERSTFPAVFLFNSKRHWCIMIFNIREINEAYPALV